MAQHSALKQQLDAVAESLYPPSMLVYNVEAQADVELGESAWECVWEDNPSCVGGIWDV